MKTKIESVDGIPIETQLLIVSSFLAVYKTREETFGLKIESCGRRYHVRYHKTKTMHCFEIWWAV